MDNFNIFNYVLPWPLISAFFIVCVVYILWLEHDKKEEPEEQEVRSHYYERMFPPFNDKQKPSKVKEYKPKFPGGTFVYPESWYKTWNKNLRDEGWTKKELKQGWRWKEQ